MGLPRVNALSSYTETKRSTPKKVMSLCQSGCLCFLWNIFFQVMLHRVSARMTEQLSSAHMNNNSGFGVVGKGKTRLKRDVSCLQGS